jgi:RND family efflux transporter MFP subunit
MMTGRLHMRPGRVFGTLTALGLAAFLAACNESGSQSQAAPPPPPVTVATPLVQKITEWDEFTGRYEATASVEVRARVSGYLQSINFTDGAMVKQGDLLFVIDPRPYQAIVDSAQADLTSAQARLDLAKVQLDRAQSLVAQSNVSRSAYDQAVQERRASEAQVAQTTAALQSAQLNLDFTQVKAPMAGRVSNRRVDIGNLVTGDPSSTLLTTIVALDPIYFEFDMSEADYLAYQRAVAAGKLPSTRDNATLIQTRLPDEQDWPHGGVMNFVDNQLNPGSGTIRARAILDNKDLFITPGQFGRLRLPGSNPYDAILVPESAILTDQSNRVVMTVKDDNTVVPKIIRPGPTYPGGLRIVRDGLTAQDKVIINGLVRARPGAKVTPQPGTIAAVPEYDAN